MHAEELAKTIDHTLLKADTTSPDVDRLCREAIAFHFAAVCVFPHFVPLADSILRGADVKVCSVIAFPYGAESLRTKVVAAEDAVAGGADEIDVVINLPAFLSGDFGRVRDELASVVRAVRMTAISTGRGQVVVKAIIETCYLSLKMKKMACKICEQAGVDFVKTSTGCGPAGATVRDVELLRGLWSQGQRLNADELLRQLDGSRLELPALATELAETLG